MAQTINVLVEAGKASAGPPLGPALGPTGINVGAVVAMINEKTKDFAGMKVPVEVTIDTKTKEFDVKTGSPPVSQMIMKEIGAEKLSSNTKLEKVGNLAIEQVIKIAKSKKDSMNCLSLKSAVKTVIGSCVSIGVIVEGMEPQEATKAVNEGRFDAEINAEKTEMSEDKKNQIAEGLSAKKSALEKQAAELKAATAAEEPVVEEGEKKEGEEEAESESDKKEADKDKKDADKDKKEGKDKKG